MEDHHRRSSSLRPLLPVTAAVVHTADIVVVLFRAVAEYVRVELDVQRRVPKQANCEKIPSKVQKRHHPQMMVYIHKVSVSGVTKV